jgi:hypothetical protein
MYANMHTRISQTETDKKESELTSKAIDRERAVGSSGPTAGDAIASWLKCVYSNLPPGCSGDCRHQPILAIKLRQSA